VDNARVSAPPRVTVLTVVYNGARFLQEAIDSILAEEFRDFEYVIVDDGSTDATPEILARAAARDPRIVLLRNETNRGIAPATNRGLAIARGEYVARLDADDLSLPGRFTREVAVLDADPDVALVSMNYETIDASGNVLGRSQRDHPPQLVEYLLHFSNAIGGHSQVMFRRSTIAALGNYDEACGAALDYDLWTRIVGHGRIVVLPEVGMRYRLHDQNLTLRVAEIQTAVGRRAVKRLLSQYLQRPLTDHEVLAFSHSWRPVLPTIDAKLANQILHEAYAVFCRSESDERVRRTARRCKARRLMNTAALLFGRGDLRNAFRHAWYAWRWNAGMAMRRGVEIVSSRARRSGTISMP
jgi:glycosyltransferase involved in cell wall biosynthesis